MKSENSVCEKSRSEEDIEKEISKLRKEAREKNIPYKVKLILLFNDTSTYFNNEKLFMECDEYAGTKTYNVSFYDKNQRICVFAMKCGYGNETITCYRPDIKGWERMLEDLYKNAKLKEEKFDKKSNQDNWGIKK